MIKILFIFSISIVLHELGLPQLGESDELVEGLVLKGRVGLCQLEGVY